MRGWCLVFALLGLASCSPKPVVVQPVAAPQRVLLKIVMAPDVPDDTLLCFYLTPLESFEHPMMAQPLCRETVGAIRGRYLEELQARR